MLNTFTTFSLQVRSTATVQPLTNSTKLYEESPFALGASCFSAFFRMIFIAISLYLKLVAIRPRAIFLPKTLSISLSYVFPSSTSISESSISRNLFYPPVLPLGPASPIMLLSSGSVPNLCYSCCCSSSICFSRSFCGSLKPLISRSSSGLQQCVATRSCYAPSLSARFNLSTCKLSSTITVKIHTEVIIIT